MSVTGGESVKKKMMKSLLGEYSSGTNTVLCKGFEPPLTSLNFASKEPDVFVIFKVVFGNGSPGFLEVCQCFSLENFGCFFTHFQRKVFVFVC